MHHLTVIKTKIVYNTFGYTSKIDPTITKMSKNVDKPHFYFEDIKASDFKEAPYFDPYYRLRHPVEPERIKQIYQQAFIYDLLYKFAKEYLPDVQDFHKNDETKKNNDKQTDTTIDSIKDKVLEYLFKNQLDESKNCKTIFQHGPELNDTENIWTEADISILRKTFANIKEQNMSLKSRMAAYENENKELKDKLERLQIETHTMPQQINAFEKENERLYIRIKDLETRYEMYMNEFQEIDKLIKGMNEERVELKSQNQQLSNEKLKLEYEIKKLEQKLSTIKSEIKLFYGAKAEKYKLHYLKEIQRLKRHLDEMTSNYEEERSKNDKNSKALEHLRSHFMTSCVIKHENTDKIDEKNIKFF